MVTDVQPPPASLRSGVAWSYAMTGGRVVVTTVLSLVLAGLLGPRAFGVLAMALAFVGLVEVVLKQGLLPAIVQRPELRPAHADTAFWLVAACGLVLTAVTVLLAPVWAEVNGLPELTRVIWALSLLVPLHALVVVQEALLRRSLRFRALALRDLSATLSGAVAGVGGALAGWGVWALVTQQLVTAVVGVAVLWRVASWRPGRRFERTAARDLYQYSTKSAAASFGLFVGNRADVLIAGALFGPVAIGLYRLAHRLTDVALEVTSRAMQGVALAGLSGVQHDLAAFRARWLKMQRITSALALPLLGLLVGTAPVLVELLGSEWSAAATPLRLLAITQCLVAISLLSGPALQAIGRPGVLAVLTWARSAMMVLGLVIAGAVVDGDPQQHQLLALVGTAASVAVVSAAASLVSLCRAAGLQLLTVLRASVPGGLASLGTIASSAAAAEATADIGMPAWLRLAVAAVTGLTSGGLVLLCCEPLIRNQARRLATLASRPRIVTSPTT